MENPIKMDDFGGTIIFGNTRIVVVFSARPIEYIMFFSSGYLRMQMLHNEQDRYLYTL